MTKPSKSFANGSILCFKVSPLLVLRNMYAYYMSGTTYLDHAGTTLYAKSLIERFSADMISNLYGNPHSASNSFFTTGPGPQSAVKLS